MQRKMQLDTCLFSNRFGFFVIIYFSCKIYKIPTFYNIEASKSSFLECQHAACTIIGQKTKQNRKICA